MPKKTQSGYREILIAAAMQEEIKVFQKKWRIEAEFSVYALNCVQTGVGKVNTALKVADRLYRPPRFGRKFPLRPKDCKLAILVGTCGAIDPKLSVGDIVIASDTLQHDFDVTPLGFKRGEVPFAEKSCWESDTRWVERAIDSVIRLKEEWYSGRILSGDRFIADKKESKRLRKEFDAIAVEFEGAAFAQVCEFYKIPWLIIKVVSDSAGDEACEEFSSFLRTSSERCYQVVEDLLINL